MKASPINSIPRDKAWLQFQAKRTGPEEVQVDYEMVLPLGEVDCRGTFDHKGRKTRPTSWRMVWLDADNNKRIPFGRSIIGTSNQHYPFYKPDERGEINLPFRDGAHSGWDNDKLGLQLYYITTDGRIYLLTPEPNPHS